MASTFNALFCAVAAVLFWTCVGLPIARRLAPSSLALPMAPALGWAVHSALALPVFLLVGFSRTSVLAVSAIALVAAIAALLTQSAKQTADDGPAVPAWAYAVAALLALAPAAALLPKFTSDGVVLAAPIFDHSKVALIDEMTRLGLPPGNPFFRGGGEPSRLAYYYLWHFSAAEFSLLTGVSGWEADAGVTWFTTFAALTLMIGLAIWFSARTSTALWLLLLGAAGSLRPVLALLTGEGTLNALIQPPSGFGGLFFQAAWVPQHIASATCVVLATVLIVEMMNRRSYLLLATLVFVVAAAYESSTWVGGVTFALAAPAVAVALLTQCEAKQRLRFFMLLAIAAVLAACLAAPFLYDQFIATAMRRGGSPVALHPYEVLGPFFPDGLRRVLDLPAYWLVFLVVEFPAVYVTGAIGLATLIASRKLGPDRHRLALAFAVLAGVSLTVSWLLISTIGYNNDLGWRAVLPGLMVLTVFAAVGLSRWLAKPAPLAAAAAIGALLLGLPEGGQILYNEPVRAAPQSSKVFAESPAMWAAVRRHSSPEERIGNNPLFLADMTPWPVNVSWALLANRRSCFAGRELTLAYAALPHARREAINAQFIRVFEGKGTPDDVQDLATLYGCRLIVVTAEDRAWANDPFANSPFYRLVESKAGHWRIYRVPSYAGIGPRYRSAASIDAGYSPANQLKPRSAQ